MSGYSSFDPILGRLNWELPAEVRLNEEELRTAKQVDLNYFQNEVIKSIYLLQPIADERLVNFDPFRIISEPEANSDPPSRQQEIDHIEQLLKAKLGSKEVWLVSDVSSSASEEVIEREKTKIAETSAITVYDSEQVAKRLIQWKDIKDNLCPSLQGLSDDVFEITNTAISILAPLSIAGTLAIPLQPMLWGWIALIISRVGIRNFCRHFDEK
ncbi:MAG: hypothetical protein F6J97_24765 [Leptolyngbya sp. SIO4C1]|nr:hypothetical protein [Leptolyngbya sp. SIO4C1]